MLTNMQIQYFTQIAYTLGKVISLFCCKESSLSDCMIVITSSGYEGDDETASCCQSDTDVVTCPSKIKIFNNSTELQSERLWTTNSSKRFVTYTIPKSSYPYVQNIKIQKRPRHGISDNEFR